MSTGASWLHVIGRKSVQFKVNKVFRGHLNEFLLTVPKGTHSIIESGSHNIGIL